MWWRDHVAGVDEVGRGPLAGAVYAAAVILHPFVKIPGLNDSKKLTAKKRKQLSVVIKEQSLSFAIAKADVAEIDEINILQASFLAMRRAVQALHVPPDLAIIDGNKIPEGLPCDAEYLVKGDAKLDCIKAASIIAKVERDNEMMRLHELYPNYGLAQHKGYPTPMHLAALREHGPSPVHRMSFAPCREAAK